MAATPAQPDPKQRNLEAELDALLTQIQKDIPDLSPASSQAPAPPHSAANSQSNPQPDSPLSLASASSSAATKTDPPKSAAPDLVDDQLAAQIQAMLDDASAQLAQGKTPAQITEESLTRQLPPEPPLSPLSPLTPPAPAPSPSALPPTVSESLSTTPDGDSSVERIDAPLADDPSQPGYHREVGSPIAASSTETTLSSQEASLQSLDEDLAQKANVEISGEFAPVHEVIQESQPSTTDSPVAQEEAAAPTEEKVTPDDIDALIAQAVAEAAPSTSSASSKTEPVEEPPQEVRAETKPVIEQGTAEQVASELDEQLAASADVQAIDGDFESVHEVPPPITPPNSPPIAPPIAPSGSPTSSGSSAIPAGSSAAMATTAAAAAASPSAKTQTTKPAKAPKPPGPSFVSILLKPVYGILTLINAPLNGLSPSARNLVGFIGLITLLNAIALIAWKLSTAPPPINPLK